jgi:hypothetical protein
MISGIRNKKQFRIVGDESQYEIGLRQEASVIPLDVLEQKLHFKQSQLGAIITDEQAKESLFKSLNCGQIFDARIRKATIESLISMLEPTNSLMP